MIQYLMSDGWWIPAGLYFIIYIYVRVGMGSFNDWYEEIIPILWLPLGICLICFIIYTEVMKMIKVCMKGSEEKCTGKPFPKVMINPNTGSVALFSSSGRGIRLVCGRQSTGMTKVGGYSETWLMGDFVDTDCEYTVGNV